MRSFFISGFGILLSLWTLAGDQPLLDSLVFPDPEVRLMLVEGTGSHPSLMLGRPMSPQAALDAGLRMPAPPDPPPTQ